MLLDVLTVGRFAKHPKAETEAVMEPFTMTLACGPYFDEGGFVGSVVLFLLVKPLAYFAFIQAFRYRVSRPIPMRFGTAVGLTLMRAGLGIALTGIAAAVLVASHSEVLWTVSWIYLYAERLFSWWLVGKVGAGLVGRRLVGWIISGTTINAAFDVAVVWGLIEGWPTQAAVVACIAGFIAALHFVGRRASLRSRFASNAVCAKCQYDLTGNLSGLCPECGHRAQHASQGHFPVAA
jgi:hypothetical protein